MTRLFAILFLAVSATTASAATIYNDRTAWETAMGAALLTTDSFSNNIFFPTDPLTFDSGVVSKANRDTVQQNVHLGSISYTTFTVSTAPEPKMVWTFPGPITGFGADFELLGDFSLAGDFDGTGEQSFNLRNSIDISSGFFGIIGSTPFTYITMRATTEKSDYMEIDDLAFGTASVAPVPLPASLPLVLLGLGALGLMRRRARS